MASLFKKTKSKPKAYEHNEITPPVSLMVGKKKTVATTIILDSDDSDDDETDGMSTNKSSKRKADIMCEDFDGEDADYKAQIQAELAARLKSSAASNPVEKVVKSPKPRDDKFTKKAKVLLTDLAKMKKTRSITSTGSASEPEIIDLDDSTPTFVVPKVAPASQRIAAAEQLGSMSGLTLNHLLALAGGASTTGAARLTTAEPEKPQCKIRTRVNGVHERKWKVALDEPFAKIKARVAEVYGLKPTDIKFEFDGDSVKDTQTPQSLDLQDDDLLDAKINKALFDAAVRCADSSKAVAAAGPNSVGVSASSSSGCSSGAAPAVEAADKPSLRIRTRLNGKHQWKWKIELTDAFSKLRANLVALYGLQVGEKVSMEFDGEAVKDAQRPADIDMEDDNIIDVKIDKAAYDRAVATAGPSK